MTENKLSFALDVAMIWIRRKWSILEVLQDYNDEDLNDKAKILIGGTTSLKSKFASLSEPLFYKFFFFFLIEPICFPGIGLAFFSPQSKHVEIWKTFSNSLNLLFSTSSNPLVIFLYVLYILW